LKIQYKIKDRKGERTVGHNEFPIMIGGSPAADIRVAGLKPHEEAAYIGLAKDRPFIQAGHSEVPVLYNGQKLEGSAWLMHADILQIGACKINFRAEDDGFILQVIAPEPELKSVAARPGGRAADDTLKIEPLTFRPDRRRQRSASFMRYRGFIGLTVGLIFILLGIAAWFVFTAKQVVIRIEPQPDRISISGSLIAPRIAGHYLLRPGSYTLQAVKKCYQQLEQPFEVGDEKSQQVQLRLEKLPGRLSVQAHRSDEPTVALSDAQVIIDGQKVGSTPVSALAVKAGSRDLEIRAANYQDLKTQVVIAGCAELQTFDFALLPGWSDVFISSIPQGAVVSLDGKSAGKTPLTVELPEGNYRLELSAAGFKTWKSQLAVRPNQPQSLKDIELKPADGTLALQTKPAGANVTIGQKFAGKTPLKIQLPANIAHEIRIAKAGYENVLRTVEVSTGKLKTLTLDLKPLLGVIHFAVEPADAELIVDGKSRGTVPPQLKLVASIHQLEIRKEGYTPYRTQITPRPGFPQEIKIALSRRTSQPSGSAGVIKAKNGYPLKLIRPQPFTMGSSRREQGRRANETLRKINLQRAFYMGVREVTNQEFKEFLTSHNSGAFKGQRLDQDDFPVVQLTWEQAALFCNWLSAKESLPPAYVKKANGLVAVAPLNTGYRLPTEAEWEYCARFTSSQAAVKYPWGNQFPPTSKSGNYADASAKNLLSAYIDNYNDGYPGTAPPAKFKANELGLYDLGGNVAEWSHDFYTIYTYNSDTADVDPSGPREGKHHVVRGSSWKHASIGKLRLAYRDYSNSKRPDLGFRICRYLK
jgi:formylglycine-generating enzyme required for sulfatase activity